jgi:asparagine synthase (glutamine-hydrolysing)
MAKALEIYGRDYTDRWSDTAVALGINQHCSLPEDRFDEQPYVTDHSTLVADVRLDNRQELGDQLQLSRSQLASMADGALLHAAWRTWGHECVHRLVGEFAFIVWNATDRSLFCARDPIGGRPLCYATVGQSIAISTMPKGILALPDMPRQLDEIRMAEYLAYVTPDSTRTFFKNISLLPAGHTLHATQDGLQIRAYWSPPSEESVRFADDEAYVECFLELFGNAVEAQLRATRPIMATVSGGLDSTSVVALSARHLAGRGERLHALTWVPRSSKHVSANGRTYISDERHHAASLTEMYPNIDHDVVEGLEGYPLTMLTPIQEAWDQPVLNPVKAPILQATAERVGQLGCGVVLLGQYGNMTVSYDGLTRISTLLRRGRLISGAREAIALARTPDWSGRSVVSTFIVPMLPGPVRQGIQAIRHRPQANAYPLSVIHPNFAAKSGFASLAQNPNWGLPKIATSNNHSLRMALLRQIDMGMPKKGLLAVTGAEFRDPTSDFRLMMYCLSIPESQFLSRGRTRWLIRRAMRGILPSMILDETRRGMQSADWAHFIIPYREQYAQAVAQCEQSELIARIINVPLLRQWIDRWPDRWTQAEYMPYGLLLLRALGAAQFIQQFEAT